MVRCGKISRSGYAEIFSGRYEISRISMIRKSVQRFSEKIMLKQQPKVR
ncbi:hypothetical protein [Bradyrhizobium sp. SEMIA]|nr:hypothetical protein [Bradyrhizobium sp. SEMIA]QOG20345.1 hypothetical protein FOM02_26360 [Bradyrhizobium sp. SEMIA]